MHNVSHYQYGSKSTENEPFSGGSCSFWKLQGLKRATCSKWTVLVYQAPAMVSQVPTQVW